jgi:V8-like Glu-specific endopeptidase
MSKDLRENTARPKRSRLGGNAGLVALVALAIFTVWSMSLINSKLNTIDERYASQMSEIRKVITTIDPGAQTDPAGRVPQALIHDRIDSVYLITLGEQADLDGVAATAWVIADGVLATNAHVAKLFNKKGNPNIYVRNRNSAERPNKVVNVTIHAGYKAFMETVEDYRPFLTTPDGTPYGLMAIQGYDVALLFVERPNELARPIPIADNATLKSLSAGDPLAMIGYPLESVFGSDLQRKNPNPRVQMGHITALTHFLGGKVPNEHAHMVIHNIASTGGNSGSPILNVNGEVVALVSHVLGFYGENGSQRADLAVELVAKKDLSNIRTVHRPQWQRMLSHFETGHEIIPWALSKSLEDEIGPVSLTQKTGRFRYSPGQRRTQALCFKNEEPAAVIGRVLDGRGRGPRVQTLAPLSSPGRNSFAAGQKCKENVINHRGIWQSKTFNVSKPGPYLLYAYDYSIHGPCSRVTIVGKPKGASAIQFISTPSVHHSYAVVGVPEDVNSLEVHYLVDWEPNQHICASRGMAGNIDYGIVHFEKTSVLGALAGGDMSSAILSGWQDLKSLYQINRKDKAEAAKGTAP